MSEKPWEKQFRKWLHEEIEDLRLKGATDADIQEAGFGPMVANLVMKRHAKDVTEDMREGLAMYGIERSSPDRLRKIAEQVRQSGDVAGITYDLEHMADLREREDRSDE